MNRGRGEIEGREMADLEVAPDPADWLPALVVGGSRADQKHFYLGYYAAQMSKLKSFPRRAYVELFAGAAFHIDSFGAWQRYHSGWRWYYR